MTTAEALEAMTDAGQFEILATRALRHLHTDCIALVHSGVNAQGKTIANPVDGFCRIAGSSPARYVMAAFTTERREKLLQKWLFDHLEHPSGKRALPRFDGDLIKASAEAAGIRRKSPHQQ